MGRRRYCKWPLCRARRFERMPPRRRNLMLSGGLPTIFVADMDAAVRFYTESLGLKLLERHGNHWASVDGGHGLTIGLHPSSAENPAGRPGSMTIGFYATRPIQEAVATLKSRGVVFQGGIVDDTQLLIAHFQDPDGNRFYIAEMKAVAHR